MECGCQRIANQTHRILAFGLLVAGSFLQWMISDKQKFKPDRCIGIATDRQKASPPISLRTCNIALRPIEQAPVKRVPMRNLGQFNMRIPQATRRRPHHLRQLRQIAGATFDRLHSLVGVKARGQFGRRPVDRIDPRHRFALIFS